jgi:GntR family negative regulator for fad regulon and positive regulator of fabA
MEPIQVQSLKNACIQRLEELILSGAWTIGMRLPSERDLAAQLSISRPVLHEALVDLAAKGLVTIEPRRGVFINDYRTSGSCALLSSLLAFSGGQLDAHFIRSMMDMRLLIETETAAQAAQNRSPEHLDDLHRILSQEDPACQDVSELTRLDFSFHLQIAIASGNLVYPLILNSFQGVYTHLTGQFFQHHIHTAIIDTVFSFHHRLVDAIYQHDAVNAQTVMREMLQHGALHLLHSLEL